MRIAHINFLPYSIKGVENKLKHQASACPQIDFYVLNTEREYVEANLHYVKVDVPKHELAKKVHLKLFRFHLIEKSIDFNAYDRVVLRLPGMDFSSVHFAKKYGHKLFIEKHGDVLQELLLANPEWPHKAKYHFSKVILEKFLRPVRGYVSVTDEIAESSCRDFGVKPHVTIANGIHVPSVPFTKFLPFDSSLSNAINMIFVASNFAPWHGLDRVLEGMKRYRGETKIHLTLIGSVPDSYASLIHEVDQNPQTSTSKEGFLSEPEMNEFFEKSTLAFSSLALHRVGLRQACVLKTRFYVARGMPIVYGYEDPDIAEDASFAYRVPVDDAPIDMSEVLRFAQACAANEGCAEQMREHALEQMSWSTKMNSLVTFLNGGS